MKPSFFSLAILFFLISASASAQVIAFKTCERKDSITLSKTMPVLAQKTIQLYKDKDPMVYKENLFRLQLVAKNYKVVAPMLREYAQETYGDSTRMKALGIAYCWYAGVMAANPKSKKEFAALFNRLFQNKYYSMDDENQNIVADYYNRDISEAKTDWEAKLNAISGKNNISVDEAVKLCRSYCSYITFSATLELGKKEIQEASDAKYSVDENVLLTMKDGGTVAVTVVRLKTVTTPLPVILKYNIYAGKDVTACKEAANKGYVGVIANTRGKRLSQDAIEPFEHDAKDAYEIIDWISKQPWCDGKVGMYGGSYLGFSQWSALKYKHPALKTIVPQASVGVGIDFPMQNGVFFDYALRWIHFVTNNKLIDLNEFMDTGHWDKTFKEYYTSGRPFRQLDSIEGRPNPIFQRWIAHPTYDSYWQHMTPQQEEFAAIDIPILTTTGYYDDDQLGAMYYYKQYQKWNKNDNYYLVIGPYDHFGAQDYPLTSLNDYKIDAVANISIHNLIFQWFDYTLKQGPKPELLKDKVNFEVMGANTWNHVPSLDKMYNQELSFYLGSNNKLTGSSDNPSGFTPLLIDLKERNDYKAPNDNEYCGFKDFEPKTLPVDKNLLVFESDPLDVPMVLSGAPKAYLDLEINKRDLDITFQLYEKKPDGSYFALSNNLERASLAKDLKQRELLIPNVKQHIPFENNFMACRQLQKGSRIVILLGVSKNNSCQINYGTGKDVSEESIKDADEPLRIKWYNSSKFIIPLMKQ